MADRVAIDFDWTPKSVALSYTVNGNTYPYSRQEDNVVRSTDDRYAAFTTPTNTLLTFTASAVVPSGVVITEYKWDFGDGSIGYGDTVSHTYLAASPQAQATLVVSDSLGRQTFRSKVLNLRPASIITVGQAIRVG